jgi:hypothetical protein
VKTTWALVAAALLTGAIAFSLMRWQRAKEQTQHQQTVALQAQVQQLETALTEKTTTKEKTPQPAPIVPVPAPPAPASSAPSVTKAPPNPAMLNDPETRALMRKQQEQGIARMADKLVSKDFVRDWKLSPQQTAEVKALAREKANAGKDLLTAMMFDGLDDDALAQRGRETKQRISDSDAALRALLGEDGFRALTEQEHRLEDSARVKRIREEFANTEHPLSTEQQDSLIDAISAERQGMTFRVDYSDVTKVDFEHIRDYFSEPNLQIYFEDLQQLNARVIERSALFLTPEQVEQLKTTQENQLQQARLTVKMTTELFNKPRGK